MKFGEIIDIFDNSGRLMLVATYKRSRRLNKTKMMEVTKEMKKIKKIMSMVLVIATLFTTFSQTVQASPVKMNTISNGIEMVEKNFTETSIYAKYYLTVNGKTMLYTEYGEIENNNFVLDTTSVEVDKDKKEISNIPDSIYFDGERCVSHSSGKIYYRYRGDFYSDSSEKVLLKKNVSWSRRWGH